MVTKIPLCVLVILEHQRSPTPSALVIVYTLLKGLFCATILRSYVNIGLFRITPTASAALSVVVAAYFLVTLVELTEKRRLLVSKVRSALCKVSYTECTTQVA
jgi:ATP-binding cassette, subfamily C (CFTR/MRP), member 1